MSIYYVYEHWRPDTDICFYVGKGKGRRAYNFRRKGHHANILKKLARNGMVAEVRLVASGLSEAEAFRIERGRISFWRATGVALANRTDGGDGVSNPSPEARAKMIKALMGNSRSKGNKHTQEARERMRAALSREETSARMKEARKGKMPALGMTHSEETRSRMSADRVGRSHSEESIAKMRQAKANMSQETREKIGAVHRGKIVTEEVRAKISASKKGAPVSDEARAKQSAIRVGRPRPQSFIDKMTGRKLSEETKARISAAALRRKVEVSDPCR